MLNNTGNVIISGKSLSVTTSGTGTLSTTAGEIHAGGDIVAFSTSDARLKANPTPIKGALAKLDSINGITFDWKEGYSDIHSRSGHDVGVLAQEVEAVLPEVVTTRDSGYKAVNYEKIVPLLIEAIKELNQKVDELSKK